MAGLLPGKHRNRFSGRPEGRFRCFPGSSPAKIWPGSPMSGPEALLRNIEYPYPSLGHGSPKGRAPWVSQRGVGEGHDPQVRVMSRDANNDTLCIQSQGLEPCSQRTPERPKKQRITSVRWPFLGAPDRAQEDPNGASKTPLGHRGDRQNSAKEKPRDT